MNENFEQTVPTNDEGSETPASNNVLRFPSEKTRPSSDAIEVTELEGKDADDALKLFDDPLFGEVHPEEVSSSPEVNTLEGVEVSELSPEDFEALSGLSLDAEKIAEVAQTEGAPMQAKISTIANAFLVGDNAAQEQIVEAQALVNEGNVSSLTNWIARKGKGVLAMIALATSLGALAPTPANAGGHNLLNQIQGVVNPINRGIAAQEQYRGIEQQQASLRLQIQQIEARKQLLATQTSTSSDISNIENRVAGNIQPRLLEANYNAQKASLNVQKATAKERFSAIQNPKASDIARYDSEMANIQARAVQIDGAYEVAQARESGQRTVKGANTDSTRVNAQIQIQQLTQQQDRLAQQIQTLELQKYTRGATNLGGILGR